MNLTHKIMLGGVSVGVLTVLSVLPAYSQGTGEYLEYSMLKSTIGAEGGAFYQSNIYRSPNNEESDLIATFSPQIKIESDLPEHDVKFIGRAEAGHYLENNKNDYIDVLTRFEGDYDLAKDHVLSVTGEYNFDHVGIGSFVDEPDDEYVEPVTYHYFEGKTQYQGKTGLLHYGAGAQAALFNYNNVERENGTTSIQDDRDRNEYMVSSNLGYEVMPSRRLYVAGSYSERVHDEMIDSSAFNSRDSSDYRAGIGFNNDKETSNLYFNFVIGYLNRDYEADQLPDIDGVDVKIESILKLTEQDRVKINVGRDIKDSYSTDNSGYIQTSAAIQYDRKIATDLTAYAKLRYLNNDFETINTATTLDREDNVYDIGVGLSYEIIEDLFANADYGYRNRSSNEDDAEFDTHKVGVSMSYKF